MASSTKHPPTLQASPAPSRGLRTTVDQAITAGRIQLPTLAMIAMISLVLPISFNIGDLLLTPSRVIFLVTMPILLIQLFQGRYGKVNRVDWLVMLHVFWISVTIAINHPHMAATFGGSTIVMTLGAYLVGRTMITTPGQMVGVALFLTLVVLFSIPFAIYETRTDQMPIPMLLDLIPGITPADKVDYEPRMGFYRVQFVFSHPIHYGLFCSIAFSLCFIGLRRYLGTAFRLVASVGVLLATFLSLSSGPFLSVLVQVALLLWSITMRWMKRPWRVLIILTAVGYVLIELGSTRPAIYAIVTRLAFNPMTANYRMLQLEYGMAQIRRTPIFGNGFNSWERPWWMSPSVDNQWLMVAMNYGLPALFLLVAAIVILMRRIASNPSTSPQFADLRLAWMFTMVSLSLTLATVAIWSELQSLFYFFLGIGVWMINWRDGPETGTAAAAAPPVSTGRYTRFGTGQSVPAVRLAPNTYRRGSS